MSLYRRLVIAATGVAVVAAAAARSRSEVPLPAREGFAGVGTAP